MKEGRENRMRLGKSREQRSQRKVVDDDGVLCEEMMRIGHGEKRKKWKAELEKKKCRGCLSVNTSPFSP